MRRSESTVGRLICITNICLVNHKAGSCLQKLRYLTLLIRCNDCKFSAAFLFKCTRGETTRRPKRLGAGDGGQMTSGAQQQGSIRLSGDKTRGGVVLGRKDLDSHSLPRYGGQIFHFMSTK